jgi:hypothetical protein
MPKKLGQVAKLVAGIQETHEDLLDELRKANNAVNTHKEVIEAGEAELAKQIKKVRPTGKTGDVVSDYARDVTAGKMITELENQRSLLVRANNDDLHTRQR